ncbi:hypothetical protein F5Y18DRAFT_443466 [Xylariaceae sp. FL1019]|nr:hypothetical protein F5Y18DRAFT_443466 [Xylariaceae sp. FL1019]
MEVDGDESLRTLAAGGAVDHSTWPALLSHITARIEKIAHDEFPIPNLPPPAPIVPSSIPPPPDSELSENFLAPLPSSPTEPASSSSQDTNKENTPVATRNANPPPPVTAPAPAPIAPAPLPPGTLPAQITQMLSEITSTLASTFPTYPPHTVQRLAELVVSPKQHYRSLATYLHALDRVVHVTSGLNVYPLPSINAQNPAGLANGIASQSLWASPGSDEALGGALLTPIPWLAPSQQVATGSATPPSQTATQESSSDLEGQVRTESTETIEGPNGVGSVETVSVSVNGIPSIGARGVGVTQGELLRQEQRAGLVPISQLVPSHHVHPGQHNASAAAQQQQQQQVRIQHQLALAQAQTQTQEQAQSSSSPDSPDSVSVPSNAASTPSSATLEEDAAAPSEDAEGAGPAVTSVHSSSAESEEKPHARGPEEIGADDLGPQSQTTSSLTATTTGRVTMQGIDLQAAVGRKALDTGKSEEEDKEDKMVVDKEGDAATPKRDAEDELEGAAAKKAKAESEEDSTGVKEEEKEKENVVEDKGDPMDKD